MGEHTRIEWCDHTFNPWIGCTKVSPGCDGCYAERSAPVRVLRSRSREPWGPDGARYLTNVWGDPLRWNKRHDAFFAQHGRRQRVFCASLADVFDNQVPVLWRANLLHLILTTPHLDWLLLTKRIGNAQAMIEEALCHLQEQVTWPFPNVWLGATVVDQAEADRDIPKLLAVPAAVRFLSIEPMLGPIEFSSVARRSDAVSQLGKKALTGIDWVICGGESGPHARPMHADWARSLRDQCAAAGVPFLFKQWGEWIDADQDECPTGPPASRWRWGDGTPFRYGASCGAEPLMCRAGKQAAGRLLDGIEHNGFPEAAP